MVTLIIASSTFSDPCVPCSPLAEDVETIAGFDTTMVFTSCATLLQVIDPELKFPKRYWPLRSASLCVQPLGILLDMLEKLGGEGAALTQPAELGLRGCRVMQQ